MPAWIERRKSHILSKNPDMPESQAWAIATQQAHKLGKTPKNYGTAEGKATAMAKYTGSRKDYRKTADRLRKAASLVALEKKSNAMMMMSQQNATPTPMGSVTPGQVTQMRPAQAPPVTMMPSVQGAPPATLPQAGTGPGPMLKKAGVLPEVLDKPRRGERLDPKSEDFAKNQAFGRAVGHGGLPGFAAGALGGGYLAGRGGSVPKALAGALTGAALGGTAGTAAMYPSKLKQQMELLKKRRAKKEKTSADIAFYEFVRELEMEKDAGAISYMKSLARKVVPKAKQAPKAFRPSAAMSEIERGQFNMARHAHRQGFDVDPKWVDKIKAEDAADKAIGIIPGQYRRPVPQRGFAPI